MNYFDRIGLDENVDDIETIKNAFEERIIQIDLNSAILYEDKDIEYAKMKKAYSIISNVRLREHYKNIIHCSDLYIVLDITMNDDIKKIRNHYNKLIKLHHPDKYGDEEACKNIQSAFDILSNEKTRKKYNKLQIVQFDELKSVYNTEPSEEDKRQKEEIDNLTNEERKALFNKLNDTFNDNKLIIGRNDDTDDGDLTHKDILQYEQFDKLSLTKQLAQRMAERDEIDELVCEIEQPKDEDDFKQKFSQAVADGKAFTIDELDNEHYGIMEQSELQEFEKDMHRRLGTENEHIKELMKIYKKERKQETYEFENEVENMKSKQEKQICDMLDDLLKDDDSVNKETDTNYTAITFDNHDHFEL